MHLFFINKFIYCIYLFSAALGLCCCTRAFSSCSEWGLLCLRCAGFSLRWLLLLRSTGSRRAGFSSYGTWAQQLWLAGSRVQAQQLWCMGQLLCSMRDLPGPGLKPTSPALASGFLTTVPPGKPYSCTFRGYFLFNVSNQTAVGGTRKRGIIYKTFFSLSWSQQYS